MNPLEAQLAYPFGTSVPAIGTTLEILPGLQWLRMRLPFALDHINLWLVEDRFAGLNGVTHGFSVIDCGIADDATRGAWENIISRHMHGLPLVRVIATHCHPDHIGLGGWLCERWNAPLWMTAGEYAFARMMSASLPGVDGTASVAHFQRHGLSDPAMLAQLQTRKNYYSSLVSDMPLTYARMQDDQEFMLGAHRWRVITGFGHAPEHAALYCEDLQILISGDMVLPRISTNVSVFSLEPEANPLQLFLDSLSKFAELPNNTLVLPAHGKPFRGLHTRIAQLRAHHAARLDEVLALCGKPQSAADIVPVMFRRPLDAHQLSFALGEALAHLHQLWRAGRLRRTLGTDSVIRFALI